MTAPGNASNSLLITGGSGFIGSTLVRQCLDEDAAHVVNLDKLTYAGLRASLDDVIDHPQHSFIEGDVNDAALVSGLLEQHRPRAVVHLAAETHVDRSIEEPPQFVRTNVLGTATLLDQAVRYWQGLPALERNEFRFVFVSTDEVFGSAQPLGKFTADSPLAPNSPYAASKAGAEHLARACAHTYGLPVNIVNPSNNYGPRQLPEKLIPKMILAAAIRQPLPLYGDGLHERDWLHVDDCCQAIRRVLHAAPAGARYLIGAEHVVANRRVLELICDLVDRRLNDGGNRRELIASAPDRPGHDRRYAVDASRLRAELGWRPTVDFAAGLRQTVDWYLDNPQWTSVALQSLRRRDALPDSTSPASHSKNR